MIRSVSILIPTHNRAELLTRTLSSLAAVRYPPLVDVDLLIIVNACTDSTLEVCHNELPRMPIRSRYVEESKPGLSVARNRAVAESKGEICVFLDDDVSIAPGWLEGMLEVYNNYPADIVGGKILLWWEAVERPNWLDPRLGAFLGFLDYGDQIVELIPPRERVGGGNFAFTRRMFEMTGPFRTDLGRVGSNFIGSEETEFSIRAKAIGARMFWAPAMCLKHWVAPHRATVDYIVRVARGAAESRIRAKQEFGLRQLFRSLFGNAYRIVRYEIQRWYAKLRGDHALELWSFIRYQDAVAAATASLRRAFGCQK